MFSAKDTKFRDFDPRPRFNSRSNRSLRFELWLGIAVVALLIVGALYSCAHAEEASNDSNTAWKQACIGDDGCIEASSSVRAEGDRFVYTYTLKSTYSEDVWVDWEAIDLILQRGTLGFPTQIELKPGKPWTLEFTSDSDPVRIDHFVYRVGRRFQGLPTPMSEDIRLLTPQGSTIYAGTAYDNAVFVPIDLLEEARYYGYPARPLIPGERWQ